MSRAHDPEASPGSPEPGRGPGRRLLAALSFPFRLPARLRAAERRVDRLEAGTVESAAALARLAGDLRAELEAVGQRLADEVATLRRDLGATGDELGLRLAGAEQRLDLAEAAQRALQGEVEQLRDRRALDLERRLDRNEVQLERASAEVTRLRDAVLPAAVARGDVLVDRLAEQIEELGSLVERLLRSEPLPAPAVSPAERRLEQGLGEVTAQVLAAFRGSEEEIRHRLDRYLGPLRSSPPVLDLGCGRGELLLLLREAGVPARGVEGDPALAQAARRRGLAVVEGDLLEALAQEPDESVGAVTAIHVLEHLPVALLAATLGEVRRVLQPGGLLLAECPNPHTLRVGASLYWRDPTHQHPLLPETLRLLVAAAGLEVEAVETLHPFPAEERLAEPAGTERPADPGLAALAAELERLEQRLDELLNGPRDFTLRARKGQPGGAE